MCESRISSCFDPHFTHLPTYIFQFEITFWLPRWITDDWWQFFLNTICVDMPDNKKIIYVGPIQHAAFHSESPMSECEYQTNLTEVRALAFWHDLWFLKVQAYCFHFPGDNFFQRLVKPFLKNKDIQLLATFYVSYIHVNLSHPLTITLRV